MNYRGSGIFWGIFGAAFLAGIFGIGNSLERGHTEGALFMGIYLVVLAVFFGWMVKTPKNGEGK